MNLLQLQNGYKAFGSKVLFQEGFFSINEGDHIGVIGPNGAGKSTLFKILIGLDTLDKGTLIRSSGLRIGYLEQELTWGQFATCEEFLKLQTETFYETPIWELKKLGISLGLHESHFQSSPHSLSGGYKMRMKLLAVLSSEPHLLLLDEPTNFLDLESILALEYFLIQYNKSFLLISHDREFLQKSTQATLEIEMGEITQFPGPIEQYFEHKELMKSVQRAQALNIDNKRKQLESFVDRFRAKASKAKQAQSKLKQLEKLKSVEIRDLPAGAHINLPDPLPTGKEILQLVDADLGYKSARISVQPRDDLEFSAHSSSEDFPQNVVQVISGVNLYLERGTHLGVVGFNGVGKSTLLKTLAGRLPLLKGQMKYGVMGGEFAGAPLRYSYYAQHVTEELDIHDTVLDSLQKGAHPDIKAQEILNLAGSLLFSGNDVYKKVSVLSGGEKSRVALGKILLQKNPLLILDEPTNHLDFNTVEVLTESLRDYLGTLIIVSHDRSFIRRVAQKILEIRDGRASIYPGTFEEYLWSLEKGIMSSFAESALHLDFSKTRTHFSSLPRSRSPHLEFSNEKQLARTNDYNEQFKNEEKLSRGKQIHILEKKMREIQRRIASIEVKINLFKKDAEEITSSLSDLNRKESIPELSSRLTEKTLLIQQEEDRLLAEMVELSDLEKEREKWNI